MNCQLHWKRLVYKCSLINQKCLLCDEPAEQPYPLCVTCEQALPWLGDQCRHCALPLPMAGLTCAPCGRCLPAFDQVIALWHFGFPVDTLISRFKHNRQWPLGRLMAELLGDDQRRSLSSWHQIGEIERIAIICAAGRDMAVRAWNANSDTPKSTPPLSDTLQARIRTLEMPLMPHSATDIRELLAKEQAITSLVPPAVERYIHEHHLYRPH